MNFDVELVLVHTGDVGPHHVLLLALDEVDRDAAGPPRSTHRDGGAAPGPARRQQRAGRGI